MTQQEKFKLEFDKVTKPPFSPSYRCLSIEPTNVSYQLSNLLNVLGDREGPDLLEELNLSLNNEYYEEYYTPDGVLGADGVQILPPNVVIQQSLEFPLMELKLLLEEWIEFCDSN